MRTLVGGVDELLSFHGVRALGAAEGNPGRSRQAMEIARSLGKPRYWCPSDKPWEMPGIRIYALGPPTDRGMIRKTASKADGALYHFGGGMGAGAFFGAAQSPADETDASADPVGENARRFMPFDEQEGLRYRPGAPDAEGGASGAHAATRAHLQTHYLARTDADGEDQAWRRIDDAWLDTAADFAIKLDNQTNNSSLVLAIELTDSGKVLLFAADAQYGNWLSWQDTKWTFKDGDGVETVVTGPDLLKRTVFYKVGHHGSHNATARENGLELMNSDELVAIIPVDKDMATSKRWTEMPLPGLVERLREKTKGRLLQTDTDYKPTITAESKAFGKALRTGPPNALTGGSLYYEIDIDG